MRRTTKPLTAVSYCPLDRPPCRSRARAPASAQLVVMVRACRTSGAVRALMRRSEAAGVALGVSTYTMLLSSLRMEGREGDAAAAHAEMQARGLATDGPVEAALGKPRATLSRQRTAHLGKLIRQGDEADAWELFDGLLERGHADAYQLSTMLRACRSSAEQLALVRRAEARGVAPCRISYNTLLGTLRLEGREGEAAALRAEMGQRGLAPDDVTDAVLSKSVRSLSRSRTQLLARPLATKRNEGGRPASRARRTRPHARWRQGSYALHDYS